MTHPPMARMMQERRGQTRRRPRGCGRQGRELCQGKAPQLRHIWGEIPPLSVPRAVVFFWFFFGTRVIRGGFVVFFGGLYFLPVLIGFGFSLCACAVHVL